MESFLLWQQTVHTTDVHPLRQGTTTLLVGWYPVRRCKNPYKRCMYTNVAAGHVTQSEWRRLGHSWNIRVYIYGIYVIIYMNVGRVTQSVCIATGYGLDGPGIDSRWGRDFPHLPDRPWGPPSLLYNGYRVFPGGRKRPGRDANPSPPSRAKV
jgi:hypothetical protein